MRSASGAGRARPGAVSAFPRFLALVVALASLAACSALEGPGYLWQSVDGHLTLMWRARPIAEVLEDSGTDEDLRRKLLLVREARAFASAELGLPDNGSYKRYAAIDRPFVLWNVFASPPLSVELRRWCFPVAGCVGYRGYYDRDDAERFAARLAAEGYDTQVAGVPAYSTLGWFDDPMPSSVLRLPDEEIARLIFHELAHQVVYVSGDTTFNESFATAVQEIGLERWLRHRQAIDGDPRPAAAWAEQRRRREDFLGLVRRTRDRLEALYRSDATDERKLAAKAEILEGMRTQYRELRRAWGGFAGYDAWFARPLGNAHLASLGAYTDLVPGFRRLYAGLGGDLEAFYAEVRRLAELPADARHEALDMRD
jgi:predicted aminopeptidase